MSAFCPPEGFIPISTDWISVKVGIASLHLSCQVSLILVHVGQM